PPSRSACRSLLASPAHGEETLRRGNGRARELEASAAVLLLIQEAEPRPLENPASYRVPWSGDEGGPDRLPGALPDVIDAGGEERVLEAPADDPAAHHEAVELPTSIGLLVLEDRECDPAVIGESILERSGDHHPVRIAQHARHLRLGI